MIRISVTELDSYRYYRDTEDASLDELLARLRKETPPTPAMMAGRAFHSALENMQDDGAHVIESEGYRFRFVADCELALPPVRELKGEVTLQTSVGPVTLVGVVDGLNGTEVQDHKFSARFDVERYADSFQWRCYLVMFGGMRFVYNVFVGKEEEPKIYAVYDFHRLPLYAYPGMQDEVLREIDDFAKFLHRYLPERRTDSLVAAIPANALSTQP